MNPSKSGSSGTHVGDGAGVPVAVAVAVGVGDGVPQDPLTVTTMVSTRHPVALTLSSEAIRKRSLMLWLEAAAGRFAFVVT